MNVPRPLYEVRDVAADGRERVVYSTRERSDAEAAAAALSAAGDHVRVVVLEARDEGDVT